jgi:hypothetical protein
VFGIVVIMIVESVFYLEMHQNKKISLKKIIFDISISKWSENIKQILFLTKTNLK